MIKDKTNLHCFFNRAKAGMAAWVAVVYFMTSAVGLYAGENAFWQARRDAAQKLRVKNDGDGVLLASATKTEFSKKSQDLLSRLPGAEPVNLVEAKTPSDWMSSVLPYGDVGEVFVSPDPEAPTLIHIQDAHGIEEAQRNVSAMIGVLKERRDINLVGLEGASGGFDLAPYRAYDPNLVKDLADFVLQKGLIAGPEYAGLTLVRAPTLFGVENPRAYWSNVKALKEAYALHPQAEKSLTEMKNVLGTLKTTGYSEELKDFDRHARLYSEGREKLGEWVGYLWGTLGGEKGKTRAVAFGGKDKSVKGHGLENVKVLLQTLALEKTLDFQAVELERLRLVERLVERLSKQELQELVDKSVAYRAGRFGYGDYHRDLMGLCEKKAINLKKHASLLSYMNYVFLAEKIDRNGLMAEMDLLENQAQDALVKNEEEMRLVNLSRQWDLLSRLVRHEMAMEDWLRYQKIRGDVVRLPDELGVKEPLPTLKPFEDFCSMAVFRNRSLVDNTLARMKKDGQTAGVLVAGGFHTDGMTALLRGKNVSYVVLTPKIKNIPEDSDYLDVLAKDPVPLDKLIAGEKIYLSHALAFDLGNETEGAKSFKASFSGTLQQIKEKGGSVQEAWARVTKKLTTGSRWNNWGSGLVNTGRSVFQPVLGMPFVETMWLVLGNAVGLVLLGHGVVLVSFGVGLLFSVAHLSLWQAFSQFRRDPSQKNLVLLLNKFGQRFLFGFFSSLLFHYGISNLNVPAFAENSLIGFGVMWAVHGVWNGVSVFGRRHNKRFLRNMETMSALFPEGSDELVYLRRLFYEDRDKATFFSEALRPDWKYVSPMTMVKLISKLTGPNAGEQSDMILRALYLELEAMGGLRRENNLWYNAKTSVEIKPPSIPTDVIGSLENYTKIKTEHYLKKFYGQENTPLPLNRGSMSVWELRRAINFTEDLVLKDKLERSLFRVYEGMGLITSDSNSVHVLVNWRLFGDDFWKSRLPGTLTRPIIESTEQQRYTFQMSDGLFGPLYQAGLIYDRDMGELRSYLSTLSAPTTLESISNVLSLWEQRWRPSGEFYDYEFLIREIVRSACFRLLATTPKKNDLSSVHVVVDALAEAGDIYAYRFQGRKSSQIDERIAFFLTSLPAMVSTEIDNAGWDMESVASVYKNLTTFHSMIYSHPSMSLPMESISFSDRIKPLLREIRETYLIPFFMANGKLKKTSTGAFLIIDEAETFEENEALERLLDKTRDWSLFPLPKEIVDNCSPPTAGGIFYGFGKTKIDKEKPMVSVPGREINEDVSFSFQLPTGVRVQGLVNGGHSDDDKGKTPRFVAKEMVSFLYRALQNRQASELGDEEVKALLKRVFSVTQKQLELKGGVNASLVVSVTLADVTYTASSGRERAYLVDSNGKFKDLTVDDLTGDEEPDLMSVHDVERYRTGRRLFVLDSVTSATDDFSPDLWRMRKMVLTGLHGRAGIRNANDSKNRFGKAPSVSKVTHVSRSSRLETPSAGILLCSSSVSRRLTRAEIEDSFSKRNPNATAVGLIARAQKPGHPFRVLREQEDLTAVWLPSYADPSGDGSIHLSQSVEEEQKASRSSPLKPKDIKEDDYTEVDNPDGWLKDGDVFASLDGWNGVREVIVVDPKNDEKLNRFLETGMLKITPNMDATTMLAVLFGHLSDHLDTPPKKAATVDLFKSGNILFHYCPTNDELNC